MPGACGCDDIKVYAEPDCWPAFYIQHEENEATLFLFSLHSLLITVLSLLGKEPEARCI